MNWFSENLAETIVIVGVLILAIEILIMGFSTFYLAFVGLSAIICGFMMYHGILQESTLTAFLSITVLTGVLAVFLWRPLKKIQSKVNKTPAKSDLIGHTFILQEDVSQSSNPTYKYSGIQWHLVSDVPLSAGTKVYVIKAEVGKFHVAEFTSDI